MNLHLKQNPAICWRDLLKSRLKDLIIEIERMSISAAHVYYVQEMHKLTLQLLWNLLHLVISIWHFVLGATNTLQSYLISSGLLGSYKALDLTELQYLAIVVDSEEARHTSKIVELLHWLSIIGVKHICLYDMEGVLKESKEIILEELGDARSWEGTDETFLLLDQKHMNLEFASFSSGKEGVAKAANFLCSNYLKIDGSDGVHDKLIFTEPKMTEALRAVGCGGPEPNLLLIYGPARCHLGFPAWRMRYTEIVHMGPLQSVKYGAVIKAIHRFTTVHQNYGS